MAGSIPGYGGGNPAAPGGPGGPGGGSEVAPSDEYTYHIPHLYTKVKVPSTQDKQHIS